MKGDMEVEVLKDPSDQEATAKARRRMERMIQSDAAHERTCYDPNSGMDKPAHYKGE